MSAQLGHIVRSGRWLRYRAKFHGLGRLLRLETAVIAALAATAVAIHFQDQLTSRNYSLDRGGAGSTYYRYVYNDAANGGRSEIREVRPLEWLCKLPGTYPYPFCGFGVLLDLSHKGQGVDLSEYDSVSLDMTYTGRAEFLRVILKNHDGTNSRLGAAAVEKINQATLSVRSGNQTVVTPLSDFVVAEWWKEQVKLSPELERPQFDNVTAIEFVTANDAIPGVHRIDIRKITFHGRIISTEAWYGGIAFCWLAMIAAFLIHRQTQVNRWKKRFANRILNSVPQVVFSIGPDGWPDFVSQQWSEHYGGDPRELLGRGWLKVVHPEDRGDALRGWTQAYSSGTPYEAEYRIRFPDGSYRWAVARARPETDAEGLVTRWFGTWTESNERVLAEQALKASERLHRGILEASADCICVLGPDGMLELMNGPGMAAVELDSIDRFKGKPWSDLWQGGSRALVTGAVTRASQGDTVRFRAFCPTAKGAPKWWDVVLTPMFDEARSVTGLLAICRDVTSDREKSEQLKWASEHDALTSLPNRRAFQARLQAASLRAMITGESLGLMLIDLDHFKHVNDSLGHSAGDEVLGEVAKRLSETIRDTDFVARVGGDEFAVILEAARSKEDVFALGQKLFGQLHMPIQVGGRVLTAGASIGGAMFPDDAQSANDLFKNADTALYALKGSGRGGTMMFDRYMLDDVEKAASQLGRARDALSEKSVLPAYQPQVEVQTGRIIGFEALLRWRHPMNGLQLPETVEEAFKDYELATKIGELMHRRVAQDIRSWMDRCLDFGRVAINASPAEFLRDDYAERLLGVLEEHRVPPEFVEIEVTEHALLEQGPEYVARALAQLKAAGVKVSLDDFGTGYSSLSHLRDFPVDLVKIDMSFIQQMNEDEEIAAIVAAVVNLARSLSIEVVAEGVETRAQLDLLKVMGCRFAQGHLFGKAIEEKEVSELLARAAAA